MKDVKTLDIGEVAKRSRLSVSTLRFYEEKGLIQSVGRHGLRRIFDTNVLEQLSLIGLAQIGGFSLAEIGTMFSSDGQPKIDREQLLKKAQELDLTIKRLCAVRDGLKHVAYCPKDNQLECSQFQRLLRIADNTQQKKRYKKNRQSIQ